MSKTALYAGTFDPFTNGHLDITKRASKLFDELVIVVAAPPNKKTFFSTAQRVDMIEDTLKELGNIKVDSWDSLIVDYARQHNIGHLVRGLRSNGDFESEFQMAMMNNELAKELETIFFMTSKDQSYISSSLIKEIKSHDGNIAEFVPTEVLKAFNHRGKK